MKEFSRQFSLRTDLARFLCVSFFTFYSHQVLAQIAAFPEAAGGGAVSVGGRGGAVIEVTNLNDSGTGSLRACVTASGPRTCVFRVSGNIQLNSGLWIDKPYLTVAGQTAPGGGIMISAKATSQSAVMIATHNVIWRYVRVRHGYHANGVDQASNIILFAGSYNVIVDHSSTSWNQDEGIGVWDGGSTNTIKNITLSWNLVAEGLSGHATGWITGSGSKSVSDAMTNIDFHNNLTMNNKHRNPLIKSKSGRLVNNLWYNFYFYYSQFGGGANYDIIGNIYKKGPMYGGVYSGYREITVFPGGNSSTANGNPSLYLLGNKGYNQPNPANDQWVMTSTVSGENGTESGNLSTNYKRNAPLAAQSFPITAESVDTLEDSMLPIVGASRRVDCSGQWVINRDSTDERLVNQYKNNSGITQLPNSENDVGGFPAIASGTPCADADRDGMPDQFELARGLNPNNSSDRNSDDDGDGYTNLEEYINGPSGSAVIQPDVTPPSVPANLVSVSATTSQINLSWTASTDNKELAGYEVYRNGAKIAVTTNTFFNDTNLTPSTIYSYQVRAKDSSGNYSNLSSALGVQTAAIPVVIPPVQPPVVDEPTTPDNGLLLHWSMNNLVSNYQVLDSSGQSQDGDLYNFSSTPAVAGKSGNALNFDGSNDYVALNNPSFHNRLTSFSVTFWINPSSLSDSRNIFFNLNGTGLYPRAWVGTSGQISVQLKTGGVTQVLSTSNSVVRANSWVHIAISYDDQTKTMVIYANGKKISSKVFRSGALDGGTGSAFMLGYDPNLGYRMRGAIDEFRIYNRVLQASEIAQTY